MISDDKMPKTMLYLIRHGRASGNKAHILNGSRRDVPLTGLGFKQARELAKKWKIRPDVLLSSPMKRAMSTARVLARKYRMKITREPLLVEQDCGDWTGNNYFKLMQSHPQYFFYDEGTVSTYMVRVPGGESWAAICHRARKFLMHAKKKYPGKTIVAVSHGVFMHACWSVKNKIPAPEVYRINIRNTHWRRLEI